MPATQVEMAGLFMGKKHPLATLWEPQVPRITITCSTGVRTGVGRLGLALGTEQAPGGVSPASVAPIPAHTASSSTSLCEAMSSWRAELSLTLPLQLPLHTVGILSKCNCVNG